MSELIKFELSLNLVSNVEHASWNRAWLEEVPNTDEVKGAKSRETHETLETEKRMRIKSKLNIITKIRPKHDNNRAEVEQYCLYNI